MNSSGTDDPTRDPPNASSRSRFAEFASEALRYWEPRRAVYNMVLAAVVLVHLVSGWPVTQVLLTRDRVLAGLMSAVLLNLAYCAAYVAELYLQFAEVREERSRLRWSLWFLGTLLAAAIAHNSVKDVLQGLLD